MKIRDGYKKWRVLIGITLLLFVIAGCQSKNKNISNTQEVVNKHNEIENIEGLNSFVDNVNNQKETEINYVQYGIEGQRGVRTLTFNGEQINVSHSVDGKFIEKYNCKNIIVKIEKEVKYYVLSQCTGNFNGDLELLSVPIKD
ncbi:DUF4362 domain-containing protein [Gottfriedia acidiceleris]|uniref:DUF4362 domain-containing protein n=1 Tax=Gottfriedia acidiceleris TaxID=371036 RepID=UPI003D213E00